MQLAELNGPPSAARFDYPVTNDRARAERVPEPLLCLGVGVLLAFALFGGGGQGGPGDTLAQLLALAMLGWLMLRACFGRSFAWRAPPSVRWLPLLPALLPILQLLPLGLGHGAPAKIELASQLALAGQTLPLTISLNPLATERALWWLLPASAVFIATLALPSRRQMQLLAVVFFACIANVVLGAMQLADGIDSELRFYSPTNIFAAVGFFANRNHMASLLAMAIPLAIVGTAWGITRRMAGHRFSVFWILLGFALLGLLLFGILISKSRGGVLLAMLAFFAAVPLVLSMRPTRGARGVIALGTLAAVVLVAQFALVGVLQRVGQDPLSDGRWTYAKVTMAAARDYLPFGSGLGTFRNAYQPFEAKGVPDRAIVNHAHDDYLELWLEGGVPALLLVGCGLVAWSWRGLQLWVPRLHASFDASALLLPRTAWAAASLGLVHSALDFPLRTTAAMTAFALLAAIAFSGGRSSHHLFRARMNTESSPEFV